MSDARVERIGAGTVRALNTPMQSMGTARRVRRGRRWVLVVAAVVDIAAMGLAGFAWRSTSSAPGAAAADTSPAPSVMVGIPGGVAYEPTPDPSPETPAPTRPPAPVSTPQPTPAPSSPTLPPPTEAPPLATAQPLTTPEPVVAAPASAPDQSVSAFYGHAEGQEFDAAYALWSDRMRSQYPRQENLDNRFDQTADISIGEIYVAEQAAAAAKVQVNFVETYVSGSSRSFIGWWELVLVDGRWILDQPHF